MGPIGDEHASHRAIRLWLLAAAVLVLLTMSIGGMTRLTNSGLSITEWDPIMGVLPPLTSLEWLEAFDKYKTTYEYKFVNMNMTLDEFRYIYNWEWRHRLVARVIFLAVFIPFIWFLLKGRLSKGMQQKVFVILGLIVLQGFVGWMMVQSGLRSDVKVSPYRLALHLGLASLLFAMLIAMALGQDDRALPAQTAQTEDLSRSRRWGRLLIGLLFGLILFGALVAGLRGGRTHDTWPLMEGQLFPSNMFVLTPWLSNFFENPLTAQWFHRLLAYTLVVCAVLHWRGTLRREEPEPVQRSALWLVVGIGAQLLLGIVTVINQVPLPLGLLHQFWAFGLLALAIWHLYEIERHSPVDLETTSWTSETETRRTTSEPDTRTGVMASPGAGVSSAPRGDGTTRAAPRPSAGGYVPGEAGVARGPVLNVDRPITGAAPVPFRRTNLDS